MKPIVALVMAAVLSGCVSPVGGGLDALSGFSAAEAGWVRGE